MGPDGFQIEKEKVKGGHGLANALVCQKYTKILGTGKLLPAICQGLCQNCQTTTPVG